MGDTSYALRTELKGHDEDVRAVAASDHYIITGSRDKTIRVWTESAQHFETDALLLGHTGFVTCVAPIAPGELSQLPQGGVLSGSRDLSVNVWNKDTDSPTIQLTGHKYQVSCVAVGKNHEVISTSHDGTIRVQSGPQFQEVTVLRGHEGAVQAVLVLPSGDFLTGGSDAKIKLWSKGECAHTFQGHTDTVRGLALLADLGAVSASHDMTLKLWDFGGNVISELIGHTAIVYSAATSASGLIASASEDNTARVWRADGSCIATIPHPGCVWDLAFLPNNDFVTGCSDWVARVWTAEESRKAPADVQEAYRAALATKQPEASSSQAVELPEGLHLEDESALLQPGTKEGQIKVVREDGGGMAYSWSASQTWEKVGQVVGGPQGGAVEGGSSTVDGTTYDHVISVEVDDRPHPLSLGVNRGDNPYSVADDFILRHDLPATYRDQIVQYILQNTGATASVPTDEAFNPDPFTGGGAYVPGQATSFHQPGGGQSSTTVTGGGVDPFTGLASRVPAAQQSSGHIPATTMLVFDSLSNPVVVGDRIRSLSASLAAPDTTSLLLTAEEAAPNGLLDRLLSSAAAASTGSAAPGDAELELLGKLLRWPATALFPALDVTRMVVLHEPSAARLAADAGPLEMSPLGSLGAALATACAEPQQAANQQTGLRLICNAFKSPPLRAWLKMHALSLLDGFSPAFAATLKAVRGSAAAFLMNLAILLRTEPVSIELCAQAISAVVSCLSATLPEDEETMYRGVVALGTLISGSNRNEARRVANALDSRVLLTKLQVSTAGKVREAAGEAVQLLGN